MSSDTPEWDFSPINKKCSAPPSPDPFPDGEKWDEEGLKTAPYDPSRHMKHLMGYRYVVPQGLKRKKDRHKYRARERERVREDQANGNF